MAGLDLHTLGIPTEFEYMQQYCSSIGIPPVKDWHIYMAVSFFRLAAIAQGVYKRSLQGQASSSQAQHMGNIVERLARLGCEFLDRSPGGPAESCKTKLSQDGNSMFIFAVAGLRPVAQEIYFKVVDFMKREVYPREKELLEERSGPDLWKPRQAIEHLKGMAKGLKLWNLFIPIEADPDLLYGAGLTNVEYAFICEQMGKVLPAPEALPRIFAYPNYGGKLGDQETW